MFLYRENTFGTWRIQNRIHMIVLKPNIKASMPATSNCDFPLKIFKASRSFFNSMPFFKSLIVLNTSFASLISLWIASAVKSMLARFRFDAILGTDFVGPEPRYATTRSVTVVGKMKIFKASRSFFNSMPFFKSLIVLNTSFASLISLWIASAVKSMLARFRFDAILGTDFVGPEPRYATTRSVTVVGKIYFIKFATYAFYQHFFWVAWSNKPLMKGEMHECIPSVLTISILYLGQIYSKWKKQ